MRAGCRQRISIGKRRRHTSSYILSETEIIARKIGNLVNNRWFWTLPNAERMYGGGTTVCQDLSLTLIDLSIKNHAVQNEWISLHAWCIDQPRDVTWCRHAEKIRQAPRAPNIDLFPDKFRLTASTRTRRVKGVLVVPRRTFRFRARRSDAMPRHRQRAIEMTALAINMLLASFWPRHGFAVCWLRNRCWLTAATEDASEVVGRKMARDRRNSGTCTHRSPIQVSINLVWNSADLRAVNSA